MASIGTLNSKILVPHQGGSVVSVVVVSSIPGSGNFLSGVISSLTFVEAFEESSRCHWKEGCVSAVERKHGHTPGNITDLYDMTLAVNPFPNDKF